MKTKLSVPEELKKLAEKDSTIFPPNYTLVWQGHHLDGIVRILAFPKKSSLYFIFVFLESFIYGELEIDYTKIAPEEVINKSLEDISKVYMEYLQDDINNKRVTIN